jgi:hypothetical protein
MKSNDDVLLFEDYSRSPRVINKKAPNPNQKTASAEATVTEVDQYIAAQHLISEISHQFARNKSMLESWVITASANEYQTAKDNLELKLHSLGLPIAPKLDEKERAKQQEKLKKDMESSYSLHTPNTKAKLTKITEVDYEEDEEEMDPEVKNQKEKEMQHENYQQILQRNRLNSEIIRKSYDAPQILEFVRDVDVDDDITVKSVQELLEQSDFIISSINQRIIRDSEDETKENNTGSSNQEQEEKNNEFISPVLGVSVDNISYNALKRFIDEDTPQDYRNTMNNNNSARPPSTASDSVPSRPVSRQEENEMKLLKLELVIKADLYLVSFSYLPKREELFILARHHLQK